MKKIVILSAAALLSTGAFAQTDRAAYKSAWDKTEADYKAAKDQCKSMKGNAEDVCEEQAKVALAKAQLEVTQQHKNNPSDISRAQHKVAEAEYDLAKEKCDDMSGNSKSACKSEAKASFDRNVASTGASTATGAVAQNARDAGHAVADNARDAGATVAAATREKSADASVAMSDTMITTKVKAEMAADPVVKAMDVHVETKNGVVMLSGFVPSKAEADQAVKIARNTKDVKDVKSSIQIKK